MKQNTATPVRARNQNSAMFNDENLEKIFHTAYLRAFRIKASFDFFKAVLTQVIKILPLPDENIKICFLFRKAPPQTLCSDTVYVLGGGNQIVFLQIESAHVFKLNRNILQTLTGKTTEECTHHLEAMTPRIRGDYLREIDRCGTESDRKNNHTQIWNIPYAGSTAPVAVSNHLKKDLPADEKDSGVLMYLRSQIKSDGRCILDPTAEDFRLTEENELVCVDPEQTTVLRKPKHESSPKSDSDEGYDSAFSQNLRKLLSRNNAWAKTFTSSNKMPRVEALMRLVYAYMTLPAKSTWFLTRTLLASDLSLTDMQGVFQESAAGSTADNLYAFSQSPFSASMDASLLKTFKNILKTHCWVFLGSEDCANPGTGKQFIAYRFLRNQALLPSFNRRTAYTLQTVLARCPLSKSWLQQRYDQIRAQPQPQKRKAIV